MKLASMLVMVIFAGSVSASKNVADSIPFTFKAGDTARAASVNENFVYLLKRIKQSESRVDSLSGVTAALSDSVAKYKKNLNLPIGTIIGSMLSPEQFAQRFPAEALLWKLADSGKASTDFFNATDCANLPDFRGRFLRGMNVGIDSAKGDPDGNNRPAGSFQTDMVKSHNHDNSGFNRLLAVDGMNTNNGSVDLGSNEVDLLNSAPILPYGGAETRPRNVAVYWYVKVK